MDWPTPCEILGRALPSGEGPFGLRIGKSFSPVGPIPRRGVFYCPIFSVLGVEWGRGLGWGNFSSCICGQGSAYPSGFQRDSCTLSWLSRATNCPSGSREEKATLETAVFPPCWGEKLVSLSGISLKQTPQCYLPSTMLSFGIGGDGHPQSGSLGGWRWWNSAREMILGFPPCWVTILV